jgi:hypothetical protein
MNDNQISMFGWDASPGIYAAMAGFLIFRMNATPENLADGKVLRFVDCDKSEIGFLGARHLSCG